MDVVLRDDIAIDVESLATKYPIVDWKTHVLTENMMYYQIIRADGSSKNYKIFSEMLDDFNRQDVLDLHRLVQERALDKVIFTLDDISCWVSLLVLPLCLLKTFCPRSSIECKFSIKRQRQEESIANAIRSWSIPSGSLQLVKEALAKPSPSWSNIDEENLKVGERNVKQCKRKICDGHYTTTVKVLSSSGVAPYNDATLKDLKAKHPPKPASSLPHIPIDCHQLTSSNGIVLNMIKSFPRGTSCGRDGLRDNSPWIVLVFGVGVSGGGKAILHAVNCLIEDRGDEVGLLSLLVDFRNAFNLVDREAWYLDDGTVIGDTLIMGEVLKVTMKDGTCRGLHLNVDKTEVFCQMRTREAGGPSSVNFDFSSELVMKTVAKSSVLVDTVAKLNDPSAQRSFDAALCSSLECIITASSLGFGDWQWRLSTLPFEFARLGVYSVDSNIVTSGPAFDNALNTFNSKMAIDLLSNPSEVAALKLMKKLADTYFTRVTHTAEFTFSLSARKMALWKSQMEEFTSDYLRVVTISGLRQTMNGRIYRCVLCYWLGVPLFFVPNPCSSGSKVFAGDIYRDHVVSCIGIVGIKHRHNIVRDTLVDICFRSRISAGKEVDIGLGGGQDKPLRLADMLLYSWDEGLDVCVDLTGSSPLTQTGMIDFLSGRAVTEDAQCRAVIEGAQCKLVKYEAKCTILDMVLSLSRSLILWNLRRMRPEPIGMKQQDGFDGKPVAERLRELFQDPDGTYAQFIRLQEVNTDSRQPSSQVRRSSYQQTITHQQTISQESSRSGHAIMPIQDSVPQLMEIDAYFNIQHIAGLYSVVTEAMRLTNIHINQLQTNYKF
ncbi:hypothetical protein Tco_0838547 [Tanacetum coccineum]|uniref:Uncharacterized protein n=1 Tax=Tanacetum coccineum TaxID=301880 RepID=A0ABQ5AN45_9ASTR